MEHKQVETRLKGHKCLGGKEFPVTGGILVVAGWPLGRDVT